MSTQVIGEIAPQELQPDPHNPRGKLRFIDELAENIIANGILEPLVVREVDGKLQIMAGHRRQAAAIKAKLSAVPYRIATQEDERLYALQRLVSNTQRDDLSPVEQAQGIQQVLDLGATADDVAKGLSVPVEDIEKATTIAKSKKTVKEAAKNTDLTFDMVLGLAEFEDDADVYKRLLDIANDDPAEWPYEIQFQRQQRTQAKKFDAAAKEWRDKGYAVRENGPTYQTNERHLTRLVGKAKGKVMTEAEHAECPGRAVHLTLRYGEGNDVTYVPVHMCMDYKKNGHTEEVPAAVQTGMGGRSPAQTDEAKSKERKINLAMIGAGKVAEIVRREFVAGLVARKSAPKGTLAFAGSYLMGNRYGMHSRFTEMMGILAGEKYGMGSLRLGRRSDRARMTGGQQLLKDRSEAQIPLALLAFAAAEIEGQWEPNSWRGGSNEEDRKAYVAFLISCGYTPSLVEKVTIGKAKPEDVWKDQEARKAKAKETTKKSAPTKAAAPTKKAPAKKAARRAPAKKAAKKAVKRL